MAGKKRSQAYDLTSVQAMGLSNRAKELGRGTSSQALRGLSSKGTSQGSGLKTKPFHCHPTTVFSVYTKGGKRHRYCLCSKSSQKAAKQNTTYSGSSQPSTFGGQGSMVRRPLSYSLAEGEAALKVS